ncbi:tripartite tricarboxylate transporter substrate binding protein [Pigmentiphaga sp. H8]|uniref:Bug family tripartite tricarboxylate transporter substrate binding protein n=1 Tax=unclassified Pigmentiphaga TaxID=2626614 RepID=UPI000F5B751E|nr:tripartite tricarboxylate transporter substrate binding protein [Pigmentiphaga sp. H8]AZG11122.1 tripartite tricarboxylate transporter substrate binding protein [Pigmentiphaga sp. H8]
MRNLAGWKILVAAGLWCCSASLALADGWPERPLRLVVPFAPGGLTDVVARAVAERMSDELGQPIAVENRPGAGGNIGASAAARAPRDGYTLLMVSHLLALNKTAYRQIDYDLEKDFAPVGEVGRSANFLVVRPDFPAKDLAEMVAYMRRHPGKVNFAVAGAGPTAAYFAMTSRTDFATISYKGNAPALTDLVAGRIDAMMVAAETVLPYVADGRVRVVALTSSGERSPYFPEIPAAAETVPEFIAPGFLGLVTTKDTDPAIVQRLSQALRAALRSDRIQAQFKKLGIAVAESSPDQFGMKIGEEVQRWAVVVKATNGFIN